MKRIVIFLSSILMCISLAGCKNKVSVERNINHSTFDEAKAILLVITDHPDFPLSPSDTETKKLPTGGPPGTTANVKFTTKVLKDGEDTYVVTLTKDWGITVNGKYAKSFWKYKVEPNRVALLDCIDNDDLPNIMK